MLQPYSDEYFMRQALQEAQYAYEEEEIPVGAVIAIGQRIIARAHNQTERLRDVTAHAEMLALTAAANTLGSKYLPEATLYVTLEPCPMCGGALAWAQIGRVFFGASDAKRGCERIQPPIWHPKTQIHRGLLAEESRALLQSFFRKNR